MGMLCEGGEDEDSDELVDCDDPDCDGSGSCEETDRCDDGRDNDGNGLTDCEDEACAQADNCREDLNCEDGVDNDGNGKADCMDPACAAQALCGEIACTDQQDNDGNGAADCDDPNCARFEPSCQTAVEICTNSADNDGDIAVGCADSDCIDAPNCQREECYSYQQDINSNGLYDRADPDCFWSPFQNWRMSTPREVCGDLIDNDGDTFTDCADLDCVNDVACIGVEQCSDGVDTDCDGLVDCDDPDCSQSYWCTRSVMMCENSCGDEECGPDPACLEQRCIYQGGFFDTVMEPGEGTDDDQDGLYACADPDCHGVGTCGVPEICDDNIDNDGDGEVDCGDYDCQYDSPNCRGEDCYDGFDNNGNGLVDCQESKYCQMTNGVCDYAFTPSGEVCDDAGLADEDGDGWANCADSSCAYDQNCTPGEQNIEYCDNNFDDDGDGDVDCDDSDCVNEFFCQPYDPIECGSAIDPQTGVAPAPVDVDGDGLYGCTDYESCASAPNCQYENCYLDPADPNNDTNGNGLSKCDDPACQYITSECGSPPVGATLQEDPQTMCDDGIDNDGDKYIDCADTDCHYVEACLRVEDCYRPGDEDLDGLEDCADPECHLTDACIETECMDGIDNDTDGFGDCFDPDCFYAPMGGCF